MLRQGGLRQRRTQHRFTDHREGHQQSRGHPRPDQRIERTVELFLAVAAHHLVDQSRRQRPGVGHVAFLTLGLLLAAGGAHSGRAGKAAAKAGTKQGMGRVSCVPSCNAQPPDWFPALSPHPAVYSSK